MASFASQPLFIFFFSVLFITIEAEFSCESVTTSTKRMEKTTRLHFYFHDIVSGKNPTVVNIIRPHKKSAGSFGSTNMVDDPLTQKPKLSSELVGRAQGIYASASQHDVGLLMVMNFAFSEGTYNIQWEYT
ncbi:Dirigent protein 21 [Hibiscus syriacus]|uniref:Dirigent protein n=1 Tax=Hibiscus syriacus TaxID=106335 RepID=A0A6A2Z1F6_HIBSY|nr:pterocarpan synthase 1-like isoform X1 [Hibiscus syriacus]KAE8684945.1 Dirigent protein 21 [Hibiscus syriacus]